MKKSTTLTAILFATTTIMLSGCATIFGKSSYPVSINSNPTGASVSITDKKSKEVYKGQTPATVTLKSGAGFFSKSGISG
ncbi:MAG: PEGA domain-containing protein [Chitinophagaceae bacterium]|nr:PEGA domain-containing protein [Chitinophagaceae bacterium]